MRDGAGGARPPVGRDGRPERWLFGCSAGLMALIVLTGFARSFFLHAVYGTRPLTALLLWHGVRMSGWIVLFGVQAALISVRRVGWHQRLGRVGAVVAAGLVPVALVVLFADARRQLAPGDSLAGLFVAFDGLHLVAFAAFTAAGLSFRGLPAVHKRLMVFGTLNLLPPALGRLLARWVAGPQVPVAVFIALGGLVAAFVVADAAVSRKLRALDLASGVISLGIAWWTYRFQLG